MVTRSKISIQHLYLTNNKLIKIMVFIILLENMQILLLLVKKRAPFHKIELLAAICLTDSLDKEEEGDQWLNKPQILQKRTLNLS